MTTKDTLRSGASSSEDTSDFYNRLMRGEEKRGILGKSTRYNPLQLCQKPSVIRYFDGFIKKYITSDDVVLDFGCGPGTFAIRMAGYCKSVVGVDITEEFINEATQSFEVLGLTNATAIHVAPNQLPFQAASFDAIMMMDVIHHLDDIPTSLTEVLRVLKPGGKILIFEPNKLNPLIWLVHYLDKNERGLLALGTPWKYISILRQYSSKIQYQYNGIVIGPQSKVFDLISALINHKLFYPLFGWLNPKIALYAEANTRA